MVVLGKVKSAVFVRLFGASSHRRLEKRVFETFVLVCAVFLMFRRFSMRLIFLRLLSFSRMFLRSFLYHLAVPPAPPAVSETNQLQSQSVAD